MATSCDEMWELATSSVPSQTTFPRIYPDHIDAQDPRFFRYVADRAFNDKSYKTTSLKLEALGWSVKTPWLDGIQKTVDWYNSNLDHFGDVQDALDAHYGFLSKQGAGDKHDFDLMDQSSSSLQQQGVGSSRLESTPTASLPLRTPQERTEATDGSIDPVGSRAKEFFQGKKF